MQDFGALNGASSLMLGFIAVLWVGLLIPVIVRRRNETAAARHAVRLQQTIRAMAETASAPEVLEMELSARRVRAQQREFHKHRRAIEKAERERARAEAEAKRRESELDAERATQELEEAKLRAEQWRRAAASRTAALHVERANTEDMTMVDSDARRAAAARARNAAAARSGLEASARGADGRGASERWANGASGCERAVERRLTGESPMIAPRSNVAKARLRRGRLAATGLGALGLILAVAGALMLPSIGWLLLAVGVVLVIASVLLLNQMQRVANRAMTATRPAMRAETEPVALAPAARPEFMLPEFEAVLTQETGEVEGAWTPRPLPKPLYMERATVAELAAEDERASAPTPTPDGPGTEESAASVREELLAAAKRSEQALRDAHAEADVLEFAPRGGVDAVVIDSIETPERVHAGVAAPIGPIDYVALANSVDGGALGDLDAVLRRRRAG